MNPILPLLKVGFLFAVVVSASFAVSAAPASLQHRREDRLLFNPSECHDGARIPLRPPCAPGRTLAEYC